MDMDVLYTPEEVAKAFKVTSGTIRNLIKKGRLFAYQIGDQYRIPRFAIDQWISPFAGVDWESLGYGLWKEDVSTQDPVGYVRSLRKSAHRSVKDYLLDLEKES
jgi:excisionase family DNA binding protein